MAREQYKKYFTMKPEVTRIFDELDRFRQFCVDFGFPFNEAHLGNEYSPYGDYLRFQNGRWPRDNWGWMVRQGHKHYVHGGAPHVPHVNKNNY